jgi:superfamily II DNA or RNA helicase
VEAALRPDPGSSDESPNASFDVSLPRLEPAESAAALDIHLCAIEMQMSGSIAIRGPDDIQSQVHWSERIEPFQHQVRNLITFCRRAPVALIADDVGLGKTISAGLILSELRTRKKVRRALIVCPKLLLPQWVEELDSKFGIRGKHAVGAQLDWLLDSDQDVVVTTYDSLRGRFKDLKPDMFDMVVLDEAHKLRNLFGTQKPPTFARRMRDALERRMFKYVVMLTATPIQNRFWDLYSLIDCLATAKGHRNPFGSEAQFVARFLRDGKTSARELYPGRIGEFRRILSDYMVRTNRRESGLVFPAREVRTEICPPLPWERPLQGIVASAVQDLNPLAQTSLAVALMSSPQALLDQVARMVDKGSLAASVLRSVRDTVGARTGCAKLERLHGLVEQLRAERPEEWRVVVFTTRRRTQELIATELSRRGVAVGLIAGGAGDRNQVTVRGFQADPPSVHVVVSTDAGAEGVNLQAGNVLVNFDLPWNPMVLEQRIGRVQRLGSRHMHVVVLNLVLQDSVEMHVVARLMEKLQAVSTSIGDVEGILEATRLHDGEDLESEIRRLVVASLRGQDTALATERIRRSIEDAKRMFDEERAIVDANIGTLDAMHREGPVHPRRTVAEFVSSAFRHDAAELRAIDGGRVRCKLPGRAPFTITFDPDDPEAGRAGTLSQNAVQVFAEGRPALERLVGEWSRRGAHHVLDLRSDDEAALRQLVTRWVADELPFPVEIEGLDVRGRRDEFVGRLHLRSSIAVAFDRYEKLVTYEVGEVASVEGLAAAVPEPSPLQGELGLSDLHGVRVQDLGAVVHRDPDVSGFRRFYEARLEHELPRAGQDPSRRRSIEEQFVPRIGAELVGAEGAIHRLLDVVVAMRGPSDTGYRLALALASARRSVEYVGDRATCAVLGRALPIGLLETCAVTGARAARHLMVRSDRSGRLGLPDQAGRCEASGALLLADELGRSDVSGRSIDADLLRASHVSGRMLAPDEVVECEVTGVPLCADELARSEVTGRRFRHDEVAVCAVTGRKGHRSEFVRCAETADFVLPEHAAESAVSGRTVRKELLRPSEKPPGRLGLEREFVQCSSTGRRLLTDEVVRSAVSSRLVDRELAVLSDASGRPCLPEESVRCQESGAVLLPEESARCEVTGIVADRRLLEVSGASGRLGLRRLLEACPDSRDRGFPDEFASCEETGVRVLQGAMARCEITGKHVRRVLLGESEVSSRRGLARLMKRCAETGKRALPSELVACAETGAAVLPDQLEACGVTGQRVRRSALAASQYSGRRGIARLLQTCPDSGRRGLPDEFQLCAESGVAVLADQLDSCELTGARVRRRFLARSDVSGRLFVARSSVRSQRSARVCMPDEIVSCAWSGLQLAVDEVGRCAVTGVDFDLRLLGEDGVFSVLSGLVRERRAVEPWSQTYALRARDVLQAAGRKVRQVWGESSPNTGLHAVVADCPRFLGLGHRMVGCIVDLNAVALVGAVGDMP